MATQVLSKAVQEALQNKFGESLSQELYEKLLSLPDAAETNLLREIRFSKDEGELYARVDALVKQFVRRGSPEESHDTPEPVRGSDFVRHAGTSHDVPPEEPVRQFRPAPKPVTLPAAEPATPKVEESRRSEAKPARSRNPLRGVGKFVAARWATRTGKIFLVMVAIILVIAFGLGTAWIRGVRLSSLGQAPAGPVDQPAGNVNQPPVDQGLPAGNAPAPNLPTYFVQYGNAVAPVPQGLLPGEVGKLTVYAPDLKTELYTVDNLTQLAVITNAVGLPPGWYLVKTIDKGWGFARASEVTLTGQTIDVQYQDVQINELLASASPLSAGPQTRLSPERAILLLFVLVVLFLAGIAWGMNEEGGIDDVIATGIFVALSLVGPAAFRLYALTKGADGSAVFEATVQGAAFGFSFLLIAALIYKVFDPIADIEIEHVATTNPNRSQTVRTVNWLSNVTPMSLSMFSLVMGLMPVLRVATPITIALGIDVSGGTPGFGQILDGLLQLHLPAVVTYCIVCLVISYLTMLWENAEAMGAALVTLLVPLLYFVLRIWLEPIWVLLLVAGLSVIAGAGLHYGMHIKLGRPWSVLIMALIALGGVAILM